MMLYKEQYKPSLNSVEEQNSFLLQSNKIAVELSFIILEQWRRYLKAQLYLGLEHYHSIANIVTG